MSVVISTQVTHNAGKPSYWSSPKLLRPNPVPYPYGHPSCTSTASSVGTLNSEKERTVQRTQETTWFPSSCRARALSLHSVFHRSKEQAEPTPALPFCSQGRHSYCREHHELTEGSGRSCCRANGRRRNVTALREVPNRETMLFSHNFTNTADSN